MERLKEYILRNFEQFFVFVILVTVAFINYYIPQKIAFLNFYYLPVIVAGKFLGLRRAVLGAFLCILLVTVYAILYPQHFILPTTSFDLYLHLSVWGCFLILAGAVVGSQQEKIDFEIRQTRQLNEQLQQQQNELNKANVELKNYSETLEYKVKERTSELEKSKQSIEALKDKVEQTLYSTMDSSVAKLIIEGRLRNEKRTVSVMFSDLVGFTSYSEDLSPELVIRDLNRYLNDMEPILLDYHSHIDKYMGDGIMCEFGAPIDYENYRLLAVIAALKMQEKLSRANYPWQMRIGIASGSTITGLIGSRRQSYSTIGDVVNLASRLEKSCPPGSILIDDATVDGVRRFIDVRLQKDLPLPGEVDEKIEAQLDELHQELNAAKGDEEKASLYCRIGKLHMSINEAYDAGKYFERALKIQPDNVDLKVAFAEATIKREEHEKIKVKGRKQRVAAYEVIGLKDLLLDREKLPAAFVEKYSYVKDLISIPADVILPIEALDGTIGHSTVVAILSYAIASEFDVSEKEKQEILYAGFVVDIGKEIIPHHLLNRMGSLTTTELEEVHKHPAEGTCILKKMGYDSEPMLRIVRHSHESIDGSGYPDGLRGDEIPLGSKIVSVADAYDALSSWRPYREKWDREAAFDELRRGVEKGTYDSSVLDTLIRLLS